MDARCTLRNSVPQRAKARADGAIRVQPPEANIAIPARFHLTDEHNLLALHVDGDAEVITGVGTGVEDGRRGHGAEAETGSHVGGVGQEHPFLVLPIPVWSAGIAIVLHVQDGHVRSVKQALTAVIVQARQIGAESRNAAVQNSTGLPSAGAGRSKDSDRECPEAGTS